MSSFIIRRDPTVTLFNSLGLIYKGHGTAIVLSKAHSDSVAAIEMMVRTFRFNRARIITACEDLSPSDIDLPDAAAVWSWVPTNLPQATALKAADIELSLVCIPPSSWLDANGYLTTNNALRGFARHLLTGLAAFRNIGCTIKAIEVFCRPDRGQLVPQDLVALCQFVMQESVLLNVSPVPKMIVPGSTVSGALDPYVQAFASFKNLVDLWNVVAVEDSSDLGGSTRASIGERARQVAALVTSIDFSAEKTCTLVTSLHPTDQQRIVDNVCGILVNGYQQAYFDSLTSLGTIGGGIPLIEAYDPSEVDGFALTERGRWVQVLSNAIPRKGILWASEEMSKEQDKTIKALVTSTNIETAVFVLSRPELPDALNGELKLRMLNPLLSTAYEVSSVSVTTYPLTSTEHLTHSATIRDGNLTVACKRVPYGCTVFVAVTIGIKEPTQPTPGSPNCGCDDGEVIVTPPNPNAPGENPVLLETIVQMPVHWGRPTSTNYVNGTIYYDTTERKIMCWINGSWTPASLLAWE